MDTSTKHRRAHVATIPPAPGQTGIVFAELSSGERVTLHRVRILKQGSLNLTDANGKLWLAKTGESNPPTHPKTFIRRDTRSGSTVAIRHRKSKPVAVYLSDEDRKAFEADASTLGLPLSTYFRELARKNHRASQKVS